MKIKIKNGVFSLSLTRDEARHLTAPLSISKVLNSSDDYEVILTLAKPGELFTVESAFSKDVWPKGDNEQVTITPHPDTKWGGA